jgi:MFS family permease
LLLLLCRYDIGATSFVVVQLADAELSDVAWSATVADSAVWRGVITSASVGGAFVASLLVFHMAEYLGRRGEMLLSACLYLAGGLFEMLASVPTMSAELGLTALVAGRLVFGMGIGFAMHAVPTYISEMGPSKIRGGLISAKEAMIVLGMVLGYSIGYGFSSSVGECSCSC